MIAVGVYGVGGNGIPNISDGVDVFGDCSADSGGDAYGDGPNNDCRDGVAGNEVGGDVSDMSLNWMHKELQELDIPDSVKLM